MYKIYICTYVCVCVHRYVSAFNRAIFGTDFYAQLTLTMRKAVKFNLIKFTNRQADKRSGNANTISTQPTNPKVIVSLFCLFQFNYFNKGA